MSEQRYEEILGLPSYMDRREVEDLIDVISSIWQVTTGHQPSDLTSDLNTCKRWFDPVAQGQRLRRELAEIKAIPHPTEVPNAPIVFKVGLDKYLITPEGRCVLDLLQSLPHDRAGYVITDADINKYYQILARLYRDWNRHRIRTVVDLLAGETKPLQIPAAGVVIALMVNRCTSESRALTRFASGPKRDLIDQAFFAPVEAFADVLAPSRRASRGDPKLISGWMLYEARRRLDGGLVVIDARGGSNGRVWVREDDEDNVVYVVARDLARGHRLRPTPELFADAFDALVENLRKSLPRLAAFELVHERPRNTDRLRTRFIDALAQSLAGE